MGVTLRGFLSHDLLLSAQGAGAKVEALPDGRYTLDFPDDRQYEQWAWTAAPTLKGQDVVKIGHGDTAVERARRFGI